MVCVNCNKELRDGALFCPNCGQRQPSTRPESASYRAPNPGAPKGVNCPDCGKFVIYGQERCSCGWNWGRPRVTESPRPSWTSGPASPVTYSSRTATPTINVVALVAICVCLLMWLAAPFMQWGEQTALEIISDYDADSVWWQCSAILGLGILLSGIFVLCKNNGAKGAAGATVAAAILRYLIWIIDLGADDLEDVVEGFTDLLAWGWLVIVAGLLVVAIVGGKKE